MTIRATLFHFTTPAAAVAVGICITGAVAAQETNVAPARLLGSGAYSGGTLSVAGDTGYSASVSSPSGVPSLGAFRNLPDGSYTFQASAATAKVDRTSANLDNGRDARAPKPRQGVAASGTFRVVNGKIVMPAEGRSGKGDRD